MIGELVNDRVVQITVYDPRPRLPPTQPTVDGPAKPIAGVTCGKCGSQERCRRDKLCWRAERAAILLERRGRRVGYGDQLAQQRVCATTGCDELVVSPTGRLCPVCRQKAQKRARPRGGKRTRPLQ